MDLSSIGFAETATPPLAMLVRLLVAAVLGGIIGFEREAQSGTAGLRTHVLISLAAALYTLLAFEIYREALAGGSRTSDPVRAIEAVTAGIAFLGAGAIFRRARDVHGLTTGAGMWLAGAVGVASALGFYLIALATTVLAVIVLAALRAFAHRVVGNRNGPRGDHGPEK
jgi:putative Mg2+ transporter-C (MgtC) family protein